jgi:magnesium transporter
MTYLTELLRLPVIDENGRRIGRLAELAIVPAEDSRRVAGFVLRRRRRRLLIPYDAIHEVSAKAIRISTGADRLAEFYPRDDQLLITKDVLDQQIIDINGRKVVRVNDVGFTEQRTNGSCEVRVAEVDVGLGGAFRRLFQGLLPISVIRALDKRLAPRVIPWDFVDLIEIDPQRRVKLKISHDKLARLHPADLADIVEELAPAEREAIFETLDDSQAAEALSEVEPKVQRSIIQSLDTEKAADILEEMAPDEAADLLGDLPGHTTEEILEDMQPAEAEEIGELLEFPEDTAGGMMTTDFIAVPENGTVDSAVAMLRAKREVARWTNTIFLVDPKNRLSGAVPLAELFLASPSTPVAQLKADLLLSVRVDGREADVVSLFDKYNIFTLPVVEKDGQLARVVTADDVISLLKSKR